MRQERRHRPESPKTPHTTDSWDFSSTTMSSQPPSLNGRIVQKARALSIASERSQDRQETHLSKDNSTDLPQQTAMKTSTMTPPFNPEALSLPLPSDPIPINRCDDDSVHQHSLLSSHTSAMTSPNSTSPSTSPSFWNRLTRRSSRSVLVGEESPKSNSISRFLGRRLSTSLAQRPNFLPS